MLIENLVLLALQLKDFFFSLLDQLGYIYALLLRVKGLSSLSLDRVGRLVG